MRNIPVNPKSEGFLLALLPEEGVDLVQIRSADFFPLADDHFILLHLEVHRFNGCYRRLAPQLRFLAIESQIGLKKLSGNVQSCLFQGVVRTGKGRIGLHSENPLRILHLEDVIEIFMGTLLMSLYALDNQPPFKFQRRKRDIGDQAVMVNGGNQPGDSLHLEEK